MTVTNPFSCRVYPYAPPLHSTTSAGQGTVLQTKLQPIVLWQGEDINFAISGVAVVVHYVVLRYFLFEHCLDDATQATDDPCLSGNHKNLTDVRRSVSYQTAYPESPLCDYDLIEGWYRFMVNADSKMSETCPKASFVRSRFNEFLSFLVTLSLSQSHRCCGGGREVKGIVGMRK